MRVATLALLGLFISPALLAIPEGPEPNTPEWFAREAANYARTGEAPLEQLSPGFQQRLQSQSLANEGEWLQRGADDPSWFSPQAGNTNLTPLCTSWMEQCAGDPFRYPGVDPFYDNEGEVQPFVIYDAQCARISGRVWAPLGSQPGDNLPTVVIETGSVQAPETLYWWMAQALVRAGYVTLSFDVRGQGRSDFQSPSGDQGGNSDSTVFWDGLVNVIDFFRSTPDSPYPHNQTCADTYPTAVTDVNPFWDRMDFDRLGLAGHSLGASGVSRVQSYGAEGADPWPGLQDQENPVDVIVAWDSLSNISPRVPAMGHSSEYGLTPVPKTTPPDPEGHKGAYQAWKDAGLPVYQLTIQGSTHYEWSLIPTFPTTSWCADTSNNRCEGGWGLPMAEHYSLAWFDRWLKQPGEAGYEDADARLLADADWQNRYSFYYRSARAFADRNGQRQDCEDIRAGCGTEPTAAPSTSPQPTTTPTSSPQATSTPTGSPQPSATVTPTSVPTATPSTSPSAAPDPTVTPASGRQGSGSGALSWLLLSVVCVLARRSGVQRRRIIGRVKSR